MKKSVIIIGGSGKIGTFLIQKLLDDNYSVINVDRFISNIVDKNLHFFLPEEFFLSSKKKLFSDVSIIYYLACQSRPGTELESKKDYDINVVPFVRFLKSMKFFKASLIFISSAGTVYGDRNRLSNELTLTDPISIYGIHKLLMEKYLKYYSRIHSFKFCIARITNPYGFDSINFVDSGIVDTLNQRIQNRDPIDIYSNFSSVRNYIHINDVTNMLIKLQNFNLYNNLIYNISSNDHYSIKELIELFEKKYNYKFILNFIEHKNEFVLINKVSNKLFMNNFNYKLQNNLITYIKNL